MRHRTRDLPDRKFKQFMRVCKHCGKIYYTVARKGKVCPKCDTNPTRTRKYI